MIAETHKEISRAQEPEVTTVGMLWEFQVFFRDAGELRSILVRAETADQAHWHVEKAGHEVTSVGTGRPVVDWDRPYFRRDEVGAFAQRCYSAVSEAIAAGHLRKGPTGLFSREAIDRWLKEPR